MRLFAILPLLMAGTASAQVPPSVSVAAPARPTIAFDAKRIPDARQVLALLDHTAATQIADLRARPMAVKGDVVRTLTANWVSAAFLTSLTRLTRVSDESGGTA
ncbi:MAG: hypothetical protein EOP67_26725, partial [Sphingomonas sp.]